MTHPFKGAGVAMITPFKEDHSIDFKALENIVEDMIVSGMDYIVALGTTAETPTLSDAEQKDIVKCIKSKVDKRVPLIVGMGGNDTHKLVKNIESTDFSGIDGILSVTPYYNRPTPKGLFEHFRIIAKTSPVPVILYNVPSRTGTNMLPDTTLKIANSCPNVVAVKEASGELIQMAHMVKYAPEHFAVISGDDILALPSIAVGSIGLISVLANALPDKVSQLVHAANKGQYNEARELHLGLFDLTKLIFREGNPGGIKALMEILGKSLNVIRSPLCEISTELYKEIESELLTISC